MINQFNTKKGDLLIDKEGIVLEVFNIDNEYLFYTLNDPHEVQIHTILLIQGSYAQSLKPYIEGSIKITKSRLEMIIEESNE